MNTSQAASSDRQRQSKIRQVLGKAQKDPDHWVCRIVYIAGNGRRTERIVSPIKWLQLGSIRSSHIQAMCLGREGIRQFAVEQITSAELVPSADVLMPEPIK